jgi:hypothetical protein
VSYLKIKSYTFFTDSMSENFFKDGCMSSYIKIYIYDDQGISAIPSAYFPHWSKGFGDSRVILGLLASLYKNINKIKINSH